MLFKKIVRETEDEIGYRIFFQNRRKYFTTFFILRLIQKVIIILYFLHRKQTIRLREKWLCITMHTL